MTTTANLAAMLTAYEKRVLQDTSTRADFAYHSMKQSLHNMWARIYYLEASAERTAAIKRINECLANLEKRVAENEQRKYLNYYAQLTNTGKRWLMGK